MCLIKISFNNDLQTNVFFSFSCLNLMENFLAVVCNFVYIKRQLDPYHSFGWR